MDPHFLYFCPVLGVAGASEINNLNKLQNHAARIITNSRHDAPSNNLIRQLGWRKIDEMIQYEARVMVCKYVNGLAPHYLHDLFTRNIENPSYELRNTTTDLRFSKRNTDLRFPKRVLVPGRGQNCGTAFQQKQNRHRPLPL